MVTPAVVADVARRLHSASYGAKRALIEEEARRLGVSPNALYAQVRALRGRTRRVRADKGRRKVDSAAVQAVAHVKAKAEDTLNDRQLPTEVAIQIAELNGLVQPGQISRGTFDRIAREDRLFSPKRIYCRYQAHRSNQLHHVDSSGSKYLRVLGKDENGEWLIGVRTPEYTRKRSVEKLGLWCTAVVDDCSRIAWMQYTVAAGESALMVCEVLKSAWSGDPRCALKGMPESLLCDFGPLRRSQEGQHFCDALGIQFEDRMPKSPWVGGKVERPWRTWINRFELPFCLKPDEVLTLTELNRMLLSYVEEINSWAHPWILNLSRLAVYGEHLDAESVRFIPDRLGDMVWHDDMRKVTEDGLIRYENQRYAVPDHLTGRWVTTKLNSEGFLVVECDGEVFPTKPFRPHNAGEYRAHAFTPARHLSDQTSELVVQRLPHESSSAAAPTLHLHVWTEAQVQTPFDEREFTNKEEALQALCEWSGIPYHEMSSETRRMLDNILSHGQMLRKELLMEFAQNLRAARA